MIIPDSINGLPVTDVFIEDNKTIQTLKIPSSVACIRIKNCPNMIECNVNEDNEKFCSVDGIIYDKDFKILFYYPTGRKNKTFKVPDGIEQIGGTRELDYDTFEGCDLLETVVFLRKEPFKDKFSAVSSLFPPDLDCLGYVFLFDWIDESIKNKTVYVPDGTIENYEYALGDVDIYNFVPISEKPKGEIGDVNNNGKIEVLDVLDLQKYLSNKRSSTGLELDINEDDIVDVFDLIALKRMLMDSNN